MPNGPNEPCATETRSHGSPARRLHLDVIPALVLPELAWPPFGRQKCTGCQSHRSPRKSQNHDLFLRESRFDALAPPDRERSLPQFPTVSSIESRNRGTKCPKLQRGIRSQRVTNPLKHCRRKALTLMRWDRRDRLDVRGAQNRMVYRLQPPRDPLGMAYQQAMFIPCEDVYRVLQLLKQS